jgi:hypothetical protein
MIQHNVKYVSPVLDAACGTLVPVCPKPLHRAETVESPVQGKLRSGQTPPGAFPSFPLCFEQGASSHGCPNGTSSYEVSGFRGQDAVL